MPYSLNPDHMLSDLEQTWRNLRGRAKSVFREALNIVKSADFSDIPSDRVVLYSTSFLKGSPNRNNAYAFIARYQEQGFVTIDHTLAGKQLDSMNLLSDGSSISAAEARKLWCYLSRRFNLEGVSGKVIAFVQEAHPHSTYRTTELRSLMENPRVTVVGLGNEPSIETILWRDKQDLVHLITEPNPELAWFRRAEVKAPRQGSQGLSR